MSTPLTLDLRLETGVPLHRQVYGQIRAAILSGRVRSHQKLPSSRQLAQSLGISRTTVTESYDQLISEGYLETRRGAGTFVSAQIPDRLLNTDFEADFNAALSTAPGTQRSPRDQAASEPPVALSAYAQRLAHTARLSMPAQDQPAQDQLAQDILSFHYWQPDLGLFPVQQWQRLVNRHASASANRHWMTYASEPMGYLPLREAIAAHITQARAVRCEPAQILITQGTQQALGLIAQVLLDEGNAIAFEDPGYPSAHKIFRSYGAVLLPIPVDDEGLNVSCLDSLSFQADQPSKSVPKLVYVTPSHQFPTGVLMSLPRRLALLAWAERTGGFIVEDDYDSEFRYGGRPIPALQGLDTAERVLYVGTFSKVMFPGLRLGYMVLPRSLVSIFRRAKWVCDRQCSLLHQAALTDFIAEGHLAKHIRRMRLVYQARRQRLVGALQEMTGHRADIVGDMAGLHFMARLPLKAKRAGQMSAMGEFIDQAEAKGVRLSSTQSCYIALSSAHTVPVDATTSGEFIFGFGGLDEAAIGEAIARISPLFSL